MMSPPLNAWESNMRAIRSTTLLLALLLAASSAHGARAQDGTAAVRSRTPAPVMSFRGAEWLERPQRVTEEMPERVLAAMGLQRGDVVADIGAGSGYFTRRMAPLVAPGGSVYAVDVQQEMLDLLMESVAEAGLTGVVPVLGEPADPRLPAGSVDWILLVDVYHELESPTEMLARMREALAPGGRVALLEYRAEDATGEHIRAQHRMSVRQVLAEWGAAGFQLAELHEFLPSQHMFVLQAARQAGPGLASDRPILPHYDLLDAVRAGLVQVTVAGTGGEALTLSIRRTRPQPMIVTLAAGAWFAAGDPAADMVARRDGVIVLGEDGVHPWRIEARRAEGQAPLPGPADALEPAAADEWAEARDLMWLFQNADVYPAVAPTVEQIAVWIVAEDLGWEALSSHARASSVHAANAVAFAATYVNTAGVDITTRRIWTERDQFVAAITDEGLKRVFAELEAR